MIIIGFVASSTLAITSPVEHLRDNDGRQVRDYEDTMLYATRYANLPETSY